MDIKITIDLLPLARVLDRELQMEPEVGLYESSLAVPLYREGDIFDEGGYTIVGSDFLDSPNFEDIDFYDSEGDIVSLVGLTHKPPDHQPALAFLEEAVNIYLLANGLDDISLDIASNGIEAIDFPPLVLYEGYSTLSEIIEDTSEVWSNKALNSIGNISDRLISILDDEVLRSLKKDSTYYRGFFNNGYLSIVEMENINKLVVTYLYRDLKSWRN